MKQPGRRALFVGRRRMGKTSLLLRAAQNAKVRWLFCDLSTAATLNDVAQKILKQIQPKQSHGSALLKLIQKYAGSVALSKGGFCLKADIRPTTEAQELQTLEEVLEFVNETAAVTDEPIAIGFDEFQEIRRLGGDRAEWSLRGVTQHQRHVSYFYSGSDHRLLLWMTEPGAAFYKQLETITVGPIEPTLLAEWVNQRARRGGLSHADFGAEAVRLAGPCTGDVVRLAKTVFRRLAEGEAAAGVVQRAFDEISLSALSEEFVKHWHPLSRAQRAVLRLLAAGRAPTASATLREYGLASGSTVAKAVDALIDRQLLTRDDGKLVFDSPFFRQWVIGHA